MIKHAGFFQCLIVHGTNLFYHSDLSFRFRSGGRPELFNLSVLHPTMCPEVLVKLLAIQVGLVCAMRVMLTFLYDK